MKNVITICVLATMASAAYALPSDDFNDNSRNTSLWSSYKQGLPVQLLEVNERLEVRSTADGNSYSAAYIANCWGFSATGNFSFKTDFNNLTSGPPESFASTTFGLMKDLSNILLIEADYEPNNITPSYFHYELTIAGSNIEEESKERNSNDGTLYISYDAGKDELYLSDTGYWADNAWITIPDLLKGEWGSAVVMPYLAGSVRNRAMASGDAYFDNFVVDSGTILAADFSSDGKVDFNDFEIMASNWLIDCYTDPNNPVCINVTEDINNTQHIYHYDSQQYYTNYIGLSRSNFKLYAWNRSNVVSTAGGGEVEAHIDDVNNVLVVRSYTGGYSYLQQYQCGQHQCGQSCTHRDIWGNCTSWVPIWCPTYCYNTVYVPGSYSADYQVYGKRACPAGDMNCDGEVEYLDLAIFADSWLSGI